MEMERLTGMMIVIMTVFAIRQRTVVPAQMTVSEKIRASQVRDTVAVTKCVRVKRTASIVLLIVDLRQSAMMACAKILKTVVAAQTIVVYHHLLKLVAPTA